MDKSLIISNIISYLNFKTDKEFAAFLGVKQNTLSTWRSRNTIDYDLIISKCDFIDANWLITGRGSMLKTDKNTPIAIRQEDSKNIGIPLIPIEAMAGFGIGDVQVMEYECERYIIPAFKDAEFLIQVKGSSMYPKYSSGDIVACKKLPLDTFFQWNKVYVVDTEQGALIKRVKKGSNDNCILLVSENPNYDPFDLPKQQINSIALVVGVIRLE